MEATYFRGVHKAAHVKGHHELNAVVIRDTVSFFALLGDEELGFHAGRAGSGTMESFVSQSRADPYFTRPSPS